RDNAAMVFHDYDLERLTSRPGAIRDYDAAQLSTFALNGGDEGIPTLTEILDQVAGQVPVLLELKDQHGQMGPSDGLLEAATVCALQRYSGPVAVMSFNPHMVATLVKLLPHVPRGLVTGGYRVENWPELTEEMRTYLRGIPDYQSSGACFISHNFQDLDRPRVSELKALGADVLCWTVRAPEEAELARRIAANITFENYLPPIDA
ncbi:MAG: glycerophosphodiester phosphodiesterase family protein, partial [Pseudomonadota bacterium]